MARLEYRLFDRKETFPLLYQYDGIDQEEVALRFLCDYFVKEDRIFEKVSTATGPDGEYVIFVREAEDEEIINPEVVTRPEWSGIRLEIREYKEHAAYYPVVRLLHFQDVSDVLLRLSSEVLVVSGREWERTSTEIDENRKVYVVYVRPTGQGGPR